ncbi:hypothetical protein PR048_022005 [Dryococelus australis]|uniref:Uncharacterized protein n=1 Tax=Dryococelus australis TaxID=614101 RepID=A0ABQ9GZV5_9NEOP|nr:hypothetical protein PR048_022005 [Dryococelus australis]
MPACTSRSHNQSTNQTPSSSHTSDQPSTALGQGPHFNQQSPSQDLPWLKPRLDSVIPMPLTGTIELLSHSNSFIMVRGIDGEVVFLYFVARARQPQQPNISRNPENPCFQCAHQLWITGAVGIFIKLICDRHVVRPLQTPHTAIQCRSGLRCLSLLRQCAGSAEPPPAAHHRSLAEWHTYWHPPNCVPCPARCHEAAEAAGATLPPRRQSSSVPPTGRTLMPLRPRCRFSSGSCPPASLPQLYPSLIPLLHNLQTPTAAAPCSSLGMVLVLVSGRRSSLLLGSSAQSSTPTRKQTLEVLGRALSPPPLFTSVCQPRAPDDNLIQHHMCAPQKRQRNASKRATVNKLHALGKHYVNIKGNINISKQKLWVLKNVHSISHRRLEMKTDSFHNMGNHGK